jgi:hypothetical protein
MQQTPTPHATAIAYPFGLNQPTPSMNSPSLNVEPDFYNVALDQSTFSTAESVDLGNNFFSQVLQPLYSLVG